MKAAFENDLAVVDRAVVRTLGLVRARIAAFEDTQDMSAYVYSPDLEPMIVESLREGISGSAESVALPGRLGRGMADAIREIFAMALAEGRLREASDAGTLTALTPRGRMLLDHPVLLAEFLRRHGRQQGRPAAEAPLARIENPRALVFDAGIFSALEKEDMAQIHRYIGNRLAEGLRIALAYNRDDPSYESLAREILRLFIQVAVISYSDARKERLGITALYRSIGRPAVEQKDSLQIYDADSSVDFQDPMLKDQAVLMRAGLLKRAVRLLGMKSVVRVTWVSLIQEYAETIPGRNLRTLTPAAFEKSVQLVNMLAEQYAQELIAASA